MYLQSNLNLRVYTEAAYRIDEEIFLQGNLTYNGAAVSGNLVAVEVEDPVGDPVSMRSFQTDSFGVFNLTFRLPSETKLGAYTVHAGSNYRGGIASSNTTFVCTYLGDIDYDLKVDVGDLFLFAGSFGSGSEEPRYVQAADLDNDGDIDTTDLTLFSQNYGKH